MGKSKPKVPKAVTGGPKEKHKRKQRAGFDQKLLPPPSIAAGRPTVAAVKSKHHSYFEFVDNTKHKKKKLEFQITSKTQPPPGFMFVPIRDTNLTNACKELSREQGAMIFIVSDSGARQDHGISHQLHRTGHHVRAPIVTEARQMTADMPDPVSDGLPEPIPETQREYNAQVNKAILDLFPNIPNTARESVIQHTFDVRDRHAPKEKRKVGLCEDLTLHKRVQYAVLAHIRHKHTKYDELLKQKDWLSARRTVEAACLDVLVKWRGDEENGRDQLDEILREVVVISDSDSEASEDEEDGQDSDESLPDIGELAKPRLAPQAQPQIPGLALGGRQIANDITNGLNMRTKTRTGGAASAHPTGQWPAGKKKQSGFKRYQQAWDNAVQRNRDEDVQHSSHPAPVVGYAPQHVYGGVAPVMPREAGLIPEPNGYVAPHSQAAPVPYSMADIPPVNHGYFGQPQHPPGPSRHVSPVANGFQDLLVRSIEPVSPDNVQPPAFVRTLPPRAQLSPVRRSTQYAPAPRDGDTRDQAFYVGNNRPAESIAGRMYEHSQNQGMGPFPVGRPPHPSAVSIDGQYPPATHGAPIPAQRVAVGVGRPGEPSNPILTEDRGGFYERVHDQPAYARPQATHEAAGRWNGERPPTRVVSWEEGSRYMREAENDRDIEIIPVAEPPRDWRPAPGAPAQPYHLGPPQPPVDRRLFAPQPAGGHPGRQESAFPQPFIYVPDSPSHQGGQPPHQHQQVHETYGRNGRPPHDNNVIVLK